MRIVVMTLLICLSFSLHGCTRDAGKAGGGEESPGEDQALTAERVLGPVTVRMRVEPGKPTLSDEIRFTLTILSEEGVEVEQPAMRPVLGEFTLRNFKHDLPDMEEGLRVHRSRFTLEALRSGPHLIRPVQVKFRVAGEEGGKKEHVLKTEPLKVEVGSILGDERPDLATVRGPRGLVDVIPPPSPVPWLWIGIGGGGVLMAVVLAVFFLRRRRRVPMEKKMTPEELAYVELQALIQADLVGAKRFGAFYVELTGIVRRYIERTTDIHAPEQTTEEFLREMRGHGLFDAQKQGRLARFLEAADLIKFAARIPSAEDIESSFNSAKAFVGLAASEKAA